MNCLFAMHLMNHAMNHAGMDHAGNVHPDGNV
jgi:hypothetical protein